MLTTDQLAARLGISTMGLSMKLNKNSKVTGERIQPDVKNLGIRKNGHGWEESRVHEIAERLGLSLPKENVTA